MYVQKEKTKKNRDRLMANTVAHKKNIDQALWFKDNHPETIVQRKLQGRTNNSPKVQSSLTERMQQSIMQAIHKGTIGDGKNKIIQKRRPYDQADLNGMDGLGITYTRRDLLLTARNRYQIGPRYFFLESGDGRAGGWHLLNRHLSEFMREPYNIASGDQFVDFIDNRITNGDYSIRPANRGFDLWFEIDPDHFIIASVGDNGFIVTARPHSDNTPYDG